MTVKLRSLQERLRGSLFFVPMVFVVGSVVLAEAMLAIDERVDDVPLKLTATVDSARSVLALVGGATLAFAGVAFSVSLLLISLASNQYSPRVVYGLFRDPFNKRIIGIVVGTFTYCLVVMRAVRGPLEDGLDPTIPNLAVLLAMILGVVAVLSTIAFISHAAHTMDVSTILQRVTDEALRQVRATWPEAPDEKDAGGAPAAFAEPTEPPDHGFVVSFDREGWVQQVDADAILACIEPGSGLWLDSEAGRYAIPGTPIGTVWPPPATEADEEATRRAVRAVRAAMVMGATRTLEQDVGYGVRQLADVALKALSPGVNDPTTAHDAMFHLGAVLAEILAREPPPHRRVGDEGRVLVRSQAPTHVEMIDLAFDEVRLAAASQPTVLIYLLEILELLTTSLAGRDRATAVAALRRQAELILDTVVVPDLPDADRERVRAAFRHRFGA